MKIISKSLHDTDKIGQIIGKCLMPKTVISLEGDLGAGKTTLTQSIAKSLGVTEYVTSPTFTIIKEYNGILKLYHMDAYRLESEDDMYDLGYDEYIYSDGVCIIEWPSKIKNLIPEDSIKIIINTDYQSNERCIEILGKGKVYELIEEGLIKYEDIRD